jgi:hypothetical protein
VGPKGSLEGWQEGEGVFYTVPPKHLIKLLTGERLPFPRNLCFESFVQQDWCLFFIVSAENISLK